MSEKLVCLVTVHGIGFQESPDGGHGRPGYADDLHGALRDILPDLGDDPERTSGAVYVAGPGPPSLARLDPRRPLAHDGKQFAHVAIVYTGFEEGQPDLLGLAGIGVWGLCYACDYTTPGGAARMLMGTLRGLRAKGRGDDGTASRPMRLRAEAQRRLPRNRMLRLQGRAEQTELASGPFSIVWQVSQDVGGYVMRHKFRERVRGFVEAVLTSLCDRGDVRAVVLNAHSNGTVVAFDVLSDAERDLHVSGLVTAGSPLRKYATLFGWGTDAGRIPTPWINVWDPRDPVGDPLRPPPTWRRGDPYRDTHGLFHLWSPAEGEGLACQVEDREVDNVRDARTAGGGLRAHDYWANPAFQDILAGVLRDAWAREEHPTPSGAATSQSGPT